MKQALLIIAAALAIVTTNGCMSLSAREDMKLTGPYPGIRTWSATVKHVMVSTDYTDPLGPAAKPVLLPILLVDLPLSFGLDTMLLPVDLLPKKSSSAQAQPHQL